MFQWCITVLTKPEYKKLTEVNGALNLVWNKCPFMVLFTYFKIERESACIITTKTNGRVHFVVPRTRDDG